MTTTIFFSNRFDALSGAFTEFLNQLSDPHDMFSAQTQVIVPSMATADYLNQRVCDQRTVCQNGHLVSAGVITKLNFVEITRFIELLAPPKSHLLKRNVIFAALMELERASTPTLSEQIITRLNTSAAQIEKALYANTHATRLDPPKWARFTDTPIGKKTEEVLNFIQTKFNTSTIHPVLPFELLTESNTNTSFDFARLPQNVLWFDPEPLGQFEQIFLGKLIDFLKLNKNQTNTSLSIFTFSPCEEYWEDITTGHNTPLPMTQRDANDVAPTSDDDTSKLLDRHTSHFLISRCGRIPQCVGNALNNYIALQDACEFKLLLTTTNTSSNNSSSTLNTLQRDAISLKDTTTITPDDSFRVCAFESARETSAWIAAEIQSLLDNSSDLDESSRLNCEDITILVPSGIASNYAAFLHSALTLRHIPVNIRGIININQETCFDALDALIALLDGRFTRQSVLNWLFLPAIMPKDLQIHKDMLTRWINSYGILRDIDDLSRSPADYLSHDPAFSWAQGLQRIALGFAHNNETSDKFFPPLNESERITCIQWLAQIRTLFSDIQALRSASMTWSQWKNVIYNLLNAWIDDDAQNRDDEMKQIQAALNASWPSFQFGWNTDTADDYTDPADTHTINEVLPLLKLVASRLVQSYPGQMFGGIQVRPLTTDTQTSRIIFMVGLENANFPSKTPRNKAMERFSRYDIDACAFLKWFNNATDKLYLCAQLLETGDRESFNESYNNSLEDLPHLFRNTCTELAKHASIFLADIIVRLQTPDNPLFWPIPNVKEPVDRELIKTLSELKHVVQKQLSAQTHDNDNTRPDIPAEWSCFERVLNNNNVSSEYIKNAVFHPDTIHELFTPHTNPPAENNTITIPFKKLYEFLVKPRSVYRNVVFNINEYEDTVPASLRQLSCEPFESKRMSGLYESFILREELLSVHLTRFTSVSQSLAELMQDYDNITAALRSQGAWPAGYYNDLQKQRDFNYFSSVLSGVDSIIHTASTPPSSHNASTGFIYILNNGLKQSRLNVKTQPVFRAISMKEIAVTPHTNYLITGNIFPMLDEDTIIVFDSSSYLLTLNQILMALLILSVSSADSDNNHNISLPHQVLIVPKKNDLVVLRNISSFLDALSPESSGKLLQFYLRFMDKGCHELNSPGISETKTMISSSSQKMDASELYKYAGSKYFIPEKTLNHWSVWDDNNNSISEDKCDAQTYFNLLNCLRPLLPKL